MRELDNYRSIAKALTSLFHPHVEVIIHDLKTRKIKDIFNSFSKRLKGDPSLLGDESDLKNLDLFPPYFKTLANGKKIKSVSSVIRNVKAQPIGLFCINLDLSKWQQMQKFLSGFMQDTSAPSSYLFENDWKEKINEYISNYLRQNSLCLEALRKTEKKSLIRKLYDEKAFKIKNAAEYIGDLLNISRASVYNYLKESS